MGIFPFSLSLFRAAIIDPTLSRGSTAQNTLRSRPTRARDPTFTEFQSMRRHHPLHRSCSSCSTRARHDGTSTEANGCLVTCCWAAEISSSSSDCPSALAAFPSPGFAITDVAAAVATCSGTAAFNISRAAVRHLVPSQHHDGLLLSSFAACGLLGPDQRHAQGRGVLLSTIHRDRS